MDEVDSMLVDNYNSKTYLGSEVPGMKQFEALYHQMWNELK